MSDPRAEPCRVCGSTDLLPKYMSDTGQKWVHCDSCGNISKPTVDGDPIEIWNKEQTAPESHSDSSPTEVQ